MAPKQSSRSEHRAGVAAALLAAATVQVGAGFALLGLQADGAYCLRVMLSRTGFSCIEPARRGVQALLEAPTLAALVLGLRDLHAADVIFSLSLQMMPLAFTALACALAPAGQARLMLLPIVAYFAGASSVASIGLNEGPTATAWFWAMLFGLLDAPERRMALALLVLGALATLFVHEVMALLAPALAWAAWWRARRSGSAAARLLFRMLAVWFCVVAAVQWGYAIWPRNATNRDGFVAQMLGLQFIASASGLNVPAVLGLLAVCGLLAAWRWPRAGGPIALGLILICIGLLGAAILSSGWFVAPVSQFYARNLSALLSVPLAVLALCAVQRSQMAGPAAGRILAVLVSATLCYQVVQTCAWAASVTAFRDVLRGPPGVVAWEDALDATPLAQQAALLRARWGFTMPDLSILLAEGGNVRRLVRNPSGQPWQPWNPADPSTWPTGKLFRLDLPATPTPTER